MADIEWSEERRAFLAMKGQLLYGKYCGTRGEGICAENFALYHLRRGERIVVEDFLAFLETQAAALRAAGPSARQMITERLLARLRQHMAAPASAWEE